MSEIILHKNQSQIVRDLFVDKTCRNAVGVCARGFGKTYLATVTARLAVNELMRLPPQIPNKNVYMIAPTFSQAVDIFYPILAYDLQLERLATRSSSYLGTFTFPGNVELRLTSAESIDRMRGKGVYYAVNDEMSSWFNGKHVKARNAWQDVIEPCITTRWSPERAAYYQAKMNNGDYGEKYIGMEVNPGRSLTISTPKGYNFLYDMYNYQDIDSNWMGYQYDYTQSPYISNDEVERLRHILDPVTFASEYKAKFEESGKNVFYCFSRETHVKKDIAPLEKDEILYIAIDFNVDIQATSIWVIRDNILVCIDEFSGHPDTEALAVSLKTRYKEHSVINVFPDPTGNSRKTSAPVGATDINILKKAGFNVLSRGKSPPIIDSVAAVNSKLKTQSGIVGINISSKCQGVIKSLERTSWLDNNSDTATIDKSGNVEHFSDGVRYLVEYMFPIKLNGKYTARGFGF